MTIHPVHQKTMVLAQFMAQPRLLFLDLEAQMTLQTGQINPLNIAKTRRVRSAHAGRISRDALLNLGKFPEALQTQQAPFQAIVAQTVHRTQPKISNA